MAAGVLRKSPRIDRYLREPDQPKMVAARTEKKFWISRLGYFSEVSGALAL